MDSSTPIVLEIKNSAYRVKTPQLKTIISRAERSVSGNNPNMPLLFNRLPHYRNVADDLRTETDCPKGVSIYQGARIEPFPIFDAWVPQEFAPEFVEDALAHLQQRNPRTLAELEDEILYAHKTHLQNYHNAAEYEAAGKRILLYFGMLDALDIKQSGRNTAITLMQQPGFTLVSTLNGKVTNHHTIASEVGEHHMQEIADSIVEDQLDLEDAVIRIYEETGHY